MLNLPENFGPDGLRWQGLGKRPKLSWSATEGPPWLMSTEGEGVATKTDGLRICGGLLREQGGAGHGIPFSDLRRVHNEFPLLDKACAEI